MVNQAFRIKIAYRSKKKKEKENTRDRSVPHGSDKNTKSRAGNANENHLHADTAVENM